MKSLKDVGTTHPLKKDNKLKSDHHFPTFWSQFRVTSVRVTPSSSEHRRDPPWTGHHPSQSHSHPHTLRWGQDGDKADTSAIFLTELWRVRENLGPREKPFVQTWGDRCTDLPGWGALFLIDVTPKRHYSRTCCTWGTEIWPLSCILWGKTLKLKVAERGLRAGRPCRPLSLVLGEPERTPCSGSPGSRRSVGPWSPISQKLRKLIRWLIPDSADSNYSQGALSWTAGAAGPGSHRLGACEGQTLTFHSSGGWKSRWRYRQGGA